MTCSAYINPWVAGALLSTSVLIGQELPAHDWNLADDASQSVVLRLESGNDAAIVSEFRRRLQQYDRVRRRLDTTLPIAVVSDNATTIRSVIEAHKRALRSARCEAKQGDLFFKDVAEIFRRLIRESLHGVNAREFLGTITEADALPMGRPVVNASYPDGGALTTMPPELLQLLPGLPQGLEYRFMNRDLILWDPHANLIVDFIPNALNLSDES
jgi:hypothetical protein